MKWLGSCYKHMQPLRAKFLNSKKLIYFCRPGIQGRGNFMNTWVVGFRRIECPSQECRWWYNFVEAQMLFWNKQKNGVKPTFVCKFVFGEITIDCDNWFSKFCNWLSWLLWKQSIKGVECGRSTIVLVTSRMWILSYRQNYVVWISIEYDN